MKSKYRNILNLEANCGYSFKYATTHILYYIRNILYQEIFKQYLSLWYYNLWIFLFLLPFSFYMIKNKVFKCDIILPIFIKTMYLWDY